MRVEFVVLTRGIILKGMMKLSVTEADRSFKIVNRSNQQSEWKIIWIIKCVPES